MSRPELRRLLSDLAPGAQVSREDSGVLAIVEDVQVGKELPPYRLKFLFIDDGRRATAFCLRAPGGFGFSYATHVSIDGFLDLGPSSAREPERSGYDLPSVVHRARWWCAAHAHYRLTGTFPIPSFEQESTHVNHQG